MDETAWSRRFGAIALLLAVASLVVLGLGPALGMAAPPGGGGSLAFLSGVLAFEAMAVLSGPALVVSLVGLALYLRLDEEARPQARIAAWAPALIVGVPLVILISYVIALSTMGPA